LLLMELGIYQALEAILGSFAIVALAWLGSLSADLLINRPLGLSPKQIEFKRGHLHDINPVGIGSMVISALIGFMSYLGVFGEEAKHLCHFICVASCFLCVPTIAFITKGRYYLAREPDQWILNQQKSAEIIHLRAPATITCGVCENSFELEDMSYCPAYQQPICSLCCSLDVRCLDACKPRAGVSVRMLRSLYRFLPNSWVRAIYSRFGRFALLVVICNGLLAGLLALIFDQLQVKTLAESAVLDQAFVVLFIVLSIVSGVIIWLFLLAHESRVTAQRESNRQSMKLTREIDAHEQTDRELQQAKEQAERANEAKSRYLAGISHELRTPLQSVLGYAQLLAERDGLDGDQQRGLKIIHRSGQYLTDLIEGLLDISKIEAGRLDLFRNQLCLTELIDQLVEMFRIEADKKALVLNFSVQERLPDYVMGDEKRLRQILTNLLSNAVKYTDQGSVDFEVRYRNQVAEFVVRDTGTGISESNLERVFQPFERVRNSVSVYQPGTGLGLTIVKLLTEIMGGDIQVSSEQGVGSEFRVSLMLPWVEQQLAEDIQRSKIVGFEGLQRTLLVADDDPVLRGLLADLLIPLGFALIEAHDGESALEQLEHHRPDLFLLDISMPGISGLELAEHIRRRGHSEPILMLSANVEDDSHKSTYSGFYNDYLVKPVNNRQLMERLGQQLGLKWVYRSDTVEPYTVKGEGDEKRSISTQALPKDHALLIELKAYAEMGFQRGVNSSLKRIAEAEIVSDEALEALRLLSEGFQFEKMADHIEAGTI